MLADRTSVWSRNDREPFEHEPIPPSALLSNPPSKMEVDFHENPMTLESQKSGGEDFSDPPMTLELEVTPLMSHLALAKGQTK